MRKIISICIFFSGLTGLNSTIKKVSGVRPQNKNLDTTPEIVVTQPEKTSTMIINETKTTRVNNFTNLPQALQDILNEDQAVNDRALLSDAERNTFLLMNDEDRSLNLINKEPLLKKIINAITLYEMNECSKENFDAQGTGAYYFYLINEGLVDYDPANPDNSTINKSSLMTSSLFCDCNDKIFKMFLGLSQSATLDSTQIQYQQNIYDAINNETLEGDKIKNRVSLRVVHPLINN